MSAEIFNFSKIYDYDSYLNYASQFKVKLGKGTQGSVSKVWINNAFPIAVKKIQLSEDKETYTKEIAAIEKEANLLMNMNHQHIMKVHFKFPYINDEKNQRLYYMGMELAPTDLQKVLKQKKKLSQYEISQLASQLSSALEYLESRNIAHRDLKPANILITEDGSYKLCDFSEYKWYEQTLKTTKNTLKGTPNYLSPELKRFLLEYYDQIDKGHNPSNQLNHDALKSDVFSFGLILLVCNGVNIGTLNSKEGELKTKIQDNCTKEMKWLLEKCLDFNPKNRMMFRDLSQYLRLDIVQAFYQLMSFQLQSQEIQKLNTENTRLTQELQKLQQKLCQMKTGSCQFQQLKNILPQEQQQKLSCKQVQIINKYEININAWINKSQADRKQEFTQNTKGLKWRNYWFRNSILNSILNYHHYLSLDLDYHHNYFINNYTHFSYHINFWNEQTGITQKYGTYWRETDGTPRTVCDEDIPAAIKIVEQLEKETEYEFDLCLRMLHSNLWDFEKSKNDLLN